MTEPHNIKLVVAYDGTHFLGWQKNGLARTVEATLQQPLEKVLQEKIHLQAASRTDAGVHAREQIVNFISHKSSLDLHRLQHSLNQMLARDIAILDIAEMPLSFHPTLDSKGKEYHYCISLGDIQLPNERLYAWHCHYHLDIDAMRKAAAYLVGQHDFEALSNHKKNESYENTIREIYGIDICVEGSALKIIVKGNQFLYKMVRNIVGLLVWVGREKIAAARISNILQSKDRKQAGVTAPAHGLFLHKVFY